MNLLAAKLYDPAVAATKATSALLAMTAFDTTNLRLAVTVPAHGMVRFRLVATVTGATTMPVIYLGVMNGSTVVGRCSPTDYPGTASAATQTVPAMVDFIATGLTPGATNFDAAYGVEVLVAATNIRYGGPNNATTNDAWGAFQFEAWDPQSQTANTTLAVDAGGRVDVSKVAGTTQTARDLGAQLDAAVTTRMASYTQPTGFLAATFPTSVASPTNITAGTITTVTNLTNAATAGDLTATMKASVTTAATAATPTAAAVTGAVGSVTGNVGGNVVGTVASVVGSVGSVAGLTASRLDVAVSTLATAANLATATGYIDTEVAAIKTVTDKLDTAVELDGAVYRFTTNALEQAPVGGGGSGLDAAGVRAAIGLASANLDTQLAKLDTIDDFLDTEVAAIKAKTDNLPASPASSGDVTTVGSAVTAVQSDVTAVKTQTDKLAFTVPNQLDVNLTSVKGAAVTGAGTEGDPWGP